MKHYRILMPLVLAAFLAGCTSAATQQTPTGVPVAEPTATPPSEPTAAPTGVPASEPTATPASEPTADGGVTEEGYHFLGRADAPATIVMYSDVF